MDILLSIFTTSLLVMTLGVYAYQDDDKALEENLVLDIAWFACFMSGIALVFTVLLKIFTAMIGG